jgi:hypothetical protein
MAALWILIGEGDAALNATPALVLQPAICSERISAVRIDQIALLG